MEILIRKLYKNENGFGNNHDIRESNENTLREGKFSVDSVDMKMREYWSSEKRWKGGLTARGKREYTCTLGVS